jgi:hypothetical protein
MRQIGKVRQIANTSVLAVAIATALMCSRAVAEPTITDLNLTLGGTGKTDAIGGTGRTDAIGGTGRTDAIGGTGRTDAIGGTGRTDAIGGTGRTDAIGGTGRTDAIGGTGKTDAIGGTGRTDAIGGTGRTDAIGGTGRTDAIGGTGRTELTIEPDILGPVANIALESGSSIVVLGQHIELTGSTLVKGIVTEGAYVAIFAEMNGAGELSATKVAVLDEAYVPGSSEVIVTGTVDAVNESIGTASISSLDVDYNAALWESFELSSGSKIKLRGIQPNPQGSIVALDVDIE